MIDIRVLCCIQMLVLGTTSTRIICMQHIVYAAYKSYAARDAAPVAFC